MSFPQAMERHLSPNHDARDPAKPVDILLLHYTGMVSGEGAVRWLCEPASKVSSHYVVFEDGRVVQLVDETRRAWHAGKSFWAGETDINTRSVGIEIVNPGHEYGYSPFPDAQIDAVIALCHGILGRHAIPPQRVLAHSDVAPLRKQDPGELFPWRRLFEAGVGHWVPPAPIGAGPVLRPGDAGEDVNRLRQLFRHYGYGVGEDAGFGAELAAVVRAFQRHFRQERVDGFADISTIATLERLIAALGGGP
ncbi:MAG TPA: N-acetylmuramoyl-L-alanine amidase [Bauldia sp.]|nr:N-acetylmuramoyl-L-alanine amidase [Bauldia sp.]